MGKVPSQKEAFELIVQANKDLQALVEQLKSELEAETRRANSTNNARRMLGFRDDNDNLIRVKDRTADSLIDTVRMLQARLDASATAHHGAIDALTKKCVLLDKAKRLANRRADAATKALLVATHEFNNIVEGDA